MRKLCKHIGVLLMLGLLVLTSCSKKTRSENKSSEKITYDSGTVGFTESANEANLDQVSANNNVLNSQKLIKTVNLSLETLVYDETIAFLNQKVIEFGGYIEESNSVGNSIYANFMRHASMIIRIPSTRLDEFINLVGKNTTITAKMESTDDITSQYIDAESRKKSLEIQQERLFALLEKAENMEDIITLEERIGQVTYELENYTSTLQKYDNLVAYSSISISLQEVSRVTQPEPANTWERIKNGLAESLYNLREGFTDFIVWFIISLPYIIIWGGIITIIIVIVLKYKKRTSLPKQKKNTEDK